MINSDVSAAQARVQATKSVLDGAMQRVMAAGLGNITAASRDCSRAQADYDDACAQLDRAQRTTQLMSVSALTTGAFGVGLTAMGNSFPQYSYAPAFNTAQAANNAAQTGLFGMSALGTLNTTLDGANSDLTSSWNPQAPTPYSGNYSQPSWSSSYGANANSAPSSFQDPYQSTQSPSFSDPYSGPAQVASDLSSLLGLSGPSSRYQASSQQTSSYSFGASYVAPRSDPYQGAIPAPDYSSSTSRPILSSSPQGSPDLAKANRYDSTSSQRMDSSQLSSLLGLSSSNRGNISSIPPPASRPQNIFQQTLQAPQVSAPQRSTSTQITQPKGVNLAPVFQRAKNWLNRYESAFTKLTSLPQPMKPNDSTLSAFYAIQNEMYPMNDEIDKLYNQRNLCTREYALAFKEQTQKLSNLYYQTKCRTSDGSYVSFGLLTISQNVEQYVNRCCS